MSFETKLFIKEIYRRTVRTSGVGGLQVDLEKEYSKGKYHTKVSLKRRFFPKKLDMQKSLTRKKEA